jgi:hypothetical protein
VSSFSDPVFEAQGIAIDARAAQRKISEGNFAV